MLLNSSTGCDRDCTSSLGRGEAGYHQRHTVSSLDRGLLQTVSLQEGWERMLVTAEFGERGVLWTLDFVSLVFPLLYYTYVAPSLEV